VVDFPTYEKIAGNAVVEKQEKRYASTAASLAAADI
jgi:hypothetical protein